MISVASKPVQATDVGLKYMRKYERVKKGNVTDLIQICKAFGFFNLFESRWLDKANQNETKFLSNYREMGENRRQAGFFELGQWFHARMIRKKRLLYNHRYN